MRYGYGSPETVNQNRQAFAENQDLDFNKIFLNDQVHGKKVLVIKKDQKGNADLLEEDLPKADGLITDLKGITLVAQSADCVPILFYHPEKQIIGAAHAGWKGTSKKVVQEVVETMKKEYNIDSPGLYAVIGPSICSKDYDISDTTDNRTEIFENLIKNSDNIVIKKDGRVTLNLPEANRQLLIQSGIPENQIEQSRICTFEENESWASYRRSKDDLAYNIWTFITMVE